MKIKLPISIYSGWVTVDAELVNVAPHLNATFAVHKTDSYEYEWNKGWSVTHVETGCRALGQNFAPSKQKAIDIARKHLANKTNAGLRKAFAKLPKECTR